MRNGTIERVIFFLLSWTKVQIRLAFSRGYGGGDGMTSFCLFDAWVFNFVSKRILKAQSIPINPQPPSSICPWKLTWPVYIIGSRWRIRCSYFQWVQYCFIMKRHWEKIINSYVTFIGILLYKVSLVYSKYIKISNTCLDSEGEIFIR